MKHQQKAGKLYLNKTEVEVNILGRRKAIGPDEASSRKVAPALTPEAQENMLISLAMDRAEEQLRNGTASSQVIVHFLKLATEKARLEAAQLEKKNALLEAKTEQIRGAEERASLYADAIEAMRNYSGHGEEPVEYYDD